MPITVIERGRQTGSAHYNRPTATRDYVAFTSYDRTEIILAIANASPQFDDGIDLDTGAAIFLYRNKVEVREAQGGGGVWEATVTYESSSDSVEISFDFGVQTGKIYQSLETVSGYSCEAPGGVIGTDIPDFGGAIGSQGDKVEGVEIEVGTVQFTVTKKWRRALLPAAYVTTLAAMLDRSCVNHATYTLFWMGQTLSFDRGSLRFRTANIKQNSNEELEVSYHFHFARPIVLADNYTVAFSDKIEKEGHEHMWVHYEETVSAGRAAMTPIAVYIEKVYEHRDFSVLSI